MKGGSANRRFKRRRWSGVLGIFLSGAVVAIAMAAAVAPNLLPVDARLGREGQRVAAIVIFVGSYLSLAIGRIPGLRIDRAGIALVGASLMIASGALPLEDAYRAVDLNTITLLLGLMIVVANLRLSGFFVIVNSWILEHAKGPLILLCGVVVVSGVFSAFLLNDAICLVLTPLVLELTRITGRKPVPYLLAVAMASNIGSSATITGNPQNILIGGLSHIPFNTFILSLWPIAVIGLAVSIILIVLFHRDEFANTTRLEGPKPHIHVNRIVLTRTVLATAAMIVLFLMGIAPAKSAILVGSLLLLTQRLKSRRIYSEIDWSLLLMFAGLFIIIAGAERTIITPGLIVRARSLHLEQVPVLTAITAILSNLVSNVPAVLLIKPFVSALKDHETAWLVIAMSSTLAGNFTLLGSIANLIVVQKAASGGIKIGFWDYFRVGAPLTIMTLIIGTFWLCR
jgi:Na+/H+ antiporter NhaD/arsenite permease-like protein